MQALQLFGSFIIIILILGIWSMIWKGIGMWYAARDSKKTWFIFLLVLNTAGILPIIYIYLIRKRKKKKR